MLCGLGWDPSTGKGLYEDHDLECTFDTVFTQEDLDQVRQPFYLLLQFVLLIIDILQPTDQQVKERS